MNRFGRLRVLVLGLAFAMLWQALVPGAAMARAGGTPLHDICFGNGAKTVLADAADASRFDPTAPLDHVEVHCALCTLVGAGPQPPLSPSLTRARSERRVSLPRTDTVLEALEVAWLTPESRAPPSL
jgi:hypothetical protein